MALFKLGQVVATPGAMDATTDGERLLMLTRYTAGDWGKVPPEDAAMNDEAVKIGKRILAAYEAASSGETIWIITEWDRSVTTFLLPSEY